MRFPPGEARLIKEAVTLAVEAAAGIVSEGVAAAMNKFNKPPDTIKMGTIKMGTIKMGTVKPDGIRDEEGT
jgi:hypothetical protein